MLNYYYHFKLLLKRLFVVLIFFFICRLAFYLYNLDYFGSISFSELLKIFIIGGRFDISAIIAFNLIIIILHIIPGSFKNNKYYQKVLKILFIIINSTIIAANLGDIEYFRYTNKRTTADIFSYILLSDDVLNLIPQFLKDFWYLVLGFIAFIFLNGKYIQNSKQNFLNKNTISRLFFTSFFYFL